MRQFVSLVMMGMLWAPVATAQFVYPPTLPDAKVEVYQTVGDVDLKIYTFAPATLDKGAPAIVFFFGGGWRGGSPEQFEAHSNYLASRGMVAFIADYRVASRNQVTANECVKDAKAAVRWIRTNATRLGVDPDRIVASGGSAGGHLAACTGLVPDLEHEDQDRSINSVPNALALFNPVVLLAPTSDIPMDEKRVRTLRQRLGVDNEQISPFHHVKRGTPPTIIFHGTGDTTVPFASVELFAQAMNKAGNQCQLEAYDGRPHGFFNHGRGDGLDYVDTLTKLDRFLANLGYLQGEPTVE